MADTAGWPHWEIQFDKAGNTDTAARAATLGQVAEAGLTDLIVMSHGWNNDTNRARLLYQQWFGLLPPLLPAGSTARIGTAGVIWPAMLWPDEPLPGEPLPAEPLPGAAATADGGAAALPEPIPAAGSAGAPVAALSAVYPGYRQQQILGELAALLNAQSPDPRALDQFHGLMRMLASTESQAIDLEDSGPLAMLDEDPRALATRFAAALDAAAAQAMTGVAAAGGPGEAFDEGGAADLPDVMLADADQAGAAGFGDITARLWNGAKEALRQFTYWQMKQRAGTVGLRGLGPFLGDIGNIAPGLRIHLIGHSFGARLVSFSLSGLDLSGRRGGQPSPVRSLTLLEGAFSHFAFAPALPHDPARSGALNGMMARVAGPLLACYSTHDTAIGLFYPVASMTANDDAAALTDDLMFRWGGIGHDGAKEVNAATVTLQATGSRYGFTAGQFTNIDASAVVCHGGPPAGAHSDIIHPELGWAMLTAAGLA
jgi:hypothetical protein